MKKMLIIPLLSLFALIGCGNNASQPTINSITLSEESINLEVEGTKQLSYEIDPESQASSDVTWSSSDSQVATVSDTGLVTAVGLGSCQITVTTKIGGKTDSCSVNVKQYATYEVDFSQSYITNVDSTSSSFATTMKANLNHNDVIVDSVSAEGYLQINTNCKDYSSQAFKCLLMSSKTSDGYLTMNFASSLYSMKIYASPYASYIAYSSTWSKDDKCTLAVDGETWDITPFDGEGTVVPTYEKEFIVDDTSAVLSGVMYERVIVRKIAFKLEVTNA